ncbi:histidine phosphatase family protein [Leptolyngbya iicbica]|uniref:Histidine phosphatase family protein n=2 Tax=Cyanophyceae TaxID=3028117 RepID=A0A4Q7EH30_9CYAN|nr:histidine phosphatase family protein [Leptolyngbya sp. LK]RZM82941.1 histidine phosphatase family protein [Leptolyngbya sp. LK]
MLVNRQRLVTASLLLFALAGCGPRSEPAAAPPDTPTSSTATPTAPASEAPAESSTDSTSSAIPEAQVVEGDIWSRLRQADTHYYVLMRHAIAPGTGDPANFQVDDCATQRNLSEEGREQARRTGAAFREQNVAVQQVLSSEWCRCLDTAELLDLGPVERFPILNSFFQDRSQGPPQTQQLQEFMVANRDEAGVTVLVTHFVNISAIAGSGVSSGELVVMQVNDDNEPEVVEAIGPF